MKATVCTVLGLLLTVAVAFSAANEVYAIELAATVPVQSFPAGVAYDSDRGKIYVANSGNNTVSVISDITNTVVATIPVGNNPTGVAYDFGKNAIFVTNTDDNTVSVITDVNDTVVATIPAWGIQPKGIAYDSNTDMLFIANYGSNTVSVISDHNNTVIATITVGDKPVGVVYDSGSSEIYVANSHDPAGDSGPSTISVISDSTVVASYPGTPTDIAVIATVDLTIRTSELAYNSRRGEIIAGNKIISDSDYSVVGTLPFPRSMPYSVAYDSDKGVIFVAATNLHDGYNCTVWAISENTNEIIANLTLPKGASSGMTYDSARGTIYVANNWQQYNSTGSVYVISDASLPSVAPDPTFASSSPVVSVSPSPTPSLSPYPSYSPSIPELPQWLVFIFVGVMATVLVLCSAKKSSERNPNNS